MSKSKKRKRSHKKRSRKKKPKKTFRLKKQTHVNKQPTQEIEIENGTMYLEPGWVMGFPFTCVNKRLFFTYIILSCALVFALLPAGMALETYFGVEQIWALLVTTIVATCVITFVIPNPLTFFPCLPWKAEGHALIRQGYVELTLSGQKHTVDLNTIKKYAFSRIDDSWTIKLTLQDNSKIALFQNKLIIDNAPVFSEIAHVIAGALPDQFLKKDRQAWLFKESTQWALYFFSVIVLVVPCIADNDPDWWFGAITTFFLVHIYYIFLKSQAEINLSFVYSKKPASIINTTNNR